MSAENMDLLIRNDGEFKQNLDSYKYPDRYPGEPRGEHRAQAVETLLVPLDQRLQSALYLGGDTPCATDLAIFPFVRQFTAVEPAWFASQDWRALQRWLERCLSSALFEACMVKLVPQVVRYFPPCATVQSSG